MKTVKVLPKNGHTNEEINNLLIDRFCINILAQDDGTLIGHLHDEEIMALDDIATVEVNIKGG